MSDTSPVMCALADPADIEHPFERLREGEVFVELRETTVASRAAALEALLRRVSENETKLIWVGNPLRSPLTIERLFLQAAGPDADLRYERSPAELAAILKSAADGAPRCLIIVQQPETLDPEARDTLARIAPLLTETRPTVQFLFCGTSAFRQIRPLAAEPPLLAALGPLAYETIPERPGRGKLHLVVLLIIAGCGALIPLSIKETPVKPPQTTEAAADPPEMPSNSTGRTDTAALRREFDAFLTEQSPAISRLPQNQRDALFNEFLARQQSHGVQNKL